MDIVEKKKQEWRWWEGSVFTDTARYLHQTCISIPARASYLDYLTCAIDSRGYMVHHKEASSDCSLLSLAPGPS